MPQPERKLSGLTFGTISLGCQNESTATQQLRDLLSAHGGDLRCITPDASNAEDRGSPDASTSRFTQPLPLSDFTGMLLTGMIDAVIFRTGAGVEAFFAAASRQHNHQRIIDSLQDVEVIAASTAAQLELENSLGPISASVLSPSNRPLRPPSWRDVLTAIDAHYQPQTHTGNPLPNLRIGLEDCADWFSLSSGLEARGGQVVRIGIFEQPPPLQKSAIVGFFEQIETMEVQVLLLRSPAEAARFAWLAEHSSRARLTNHLLDHHIVVAFDDPTREILVDRGFSVDVTIMTNPVASDDLKPQQTMTAGATSSAAFALEEQVQRIAELIPKLQSRKQNSFIQMSGPNSSSNDKNAPWYNSPFMKACRGEPTDVTPIWMMRQAGRYMSEYREVRANVSFLDLCANPQLCSEVMCTAVERLGVDAAIIFSDLLPILVPMGCDLEFVKGDGPVIHNPVRTAKDIDRIKPLDSNAELEFVMETVRQTRKDLPEDMPLIGFAGAPFTLASYMIEGGSSRNYAATKQIMFSDPSAWDQLMSHLVTSISIYLKGQIEAGAQCVQLFDSWAGCLSFEDYSKRVHPYVQQIIASLPSDVPVINFATGNPSLLPLLADTRASVIGIDWRTRLDDAWQTVGYDRAVQGNLDPTVLLTDPAEIRRQAKFVLDQAAGRPGHIFNLGHGILPMTPVDNAIALVDIVHELSQR